MGSEEPPPPPPGDDLFGDADPGTPPEAGGAVPSDDLGVAPPAALGDAGADTTPPWTPDQAPNEQILNLGGGRKQGGGRKSQRASLRYEDKPIVTRLHMLEFISQKEWWYNGQTALSFTILLWLIFVYIMYTRSGVEVSYNLHTSVAQHMENIVAHPHLSGIRIRAVEDNPLPCRCACQSATAGKPKGPCDKDASEMLVFLGALPAGSPKLPAMSNQALISAKIFPVALGDKLDAGNDDIESMTWDKISEIDDVWFWIEHGFIPDVWRERSQEAGTTALQGLIAQKNLIVGGLRVRQKRAAMAPDCEKKVSDELVSFYGMECRGFEDASGYYGPPASTYGSLLPAFAPSTTTDDEGVYDAMFNVELNVTTNLATATQCRQHGWVDAATRSLNLQSMTLNAEIGMFAIIDIEFKFPPSGGVEKKIRVQTFHAVGSKIEFIDIVPELAWAACIGLLLRQEIWQMLKAGWQRKCLDYWLDMWCVVDWISIFVAVMIGLFWILQITTVGAISEGVAALPRAPFAAGPPADMDGYESNWQKILDDAYIVYQRKGYYQLSLFWYNLILASRFLKGFLSQAKLAMLQMTIGNVFWDLCHLFVFFGTLFLNFQVGGHILFGPQIESWSTMVGSAAACIRTILGSYDFDAMYQVAPISATCWFWTFLITMVFVLMNMIFAMVADHFHVIKGYTGDTDTIWEDAKNSAKDLWWRMGWRKINFSDSEYKTAFLENPYNEVKDGLMEACELPPFMARDDEHTCLGIRLGRRHIEAMSVEGLDGGRNPGYIEATSKAIQEFGADIMAADHLLELAQPHVDLETKRKNDSELAMVRHFLHLLRNHRDQLDQHCVELEDEVTDDLTGMVETMTSLERSTKGCCRQFNVLKDQGIHSLAPPLAALPRPGTLAAQEAAQLSMVAPGAFLRAIENQQSNAKKKLKQPDGRPPAPIDMHNANNSSLLALDVTAFNEEQAHARQRQGQSLRLLADSPFDTSNRKDRHRSAMYSDKIEEEQLALEPPEQPSLALEGPDGQLALEAPGLPALPPPADGPP